MMTEASAPGRPATVRADTSPDAAASWVTTKCRSECGWTCSMPSSSRTWRKNPVTLSGRIGVAQSSRPEKMNAFGAILTPQTRPTGTTGRAEPEAVAGRPRREPGSLLVGFGRFHLDAPGTSSIHRAIRKVPVAGSTSLHRRAHSSAQRAPIKAASMTSVARVGFRFSAASMSRCISAAVGGTIRSLATVGDRPSGRRWPGTIPIAPIGQAPGREPREPGGRCSAFYGRLQTGESRSRSRGVRRRT